jgi:hypothetical protein
MQQQNQLLHELLMKEKKEGSTPDYAYLTPEKPGLISSQMKNRAAMIKGSPVGKREYEEDPNGYLAAGLYESDGSPIWGHDMQLQLANIFG